MAKHTKPEATKAERKGNAGMHQQRGGIGADADEGALRQRDLPGIAERQIKAHGGDAQHRPG